MPTFGLYWWSMANHDHSIRLDPMGIDDFKRWTITSNPKNIKDKRVQSIARGKRNHHMHHYITTDMSQPLKPPNWGLEHLSDVVHDFHETWWNQHTECNLAIHLSIRSIVYNCGACKSNSKGISCILDIHLSWYV